MLNHELEVELAVEVGLFPEVADFVDEGPVVLLVREEDVFVALDKKFEMRVAQGGFSEQGLEEDLVLVLVGDHLVDLLGVTLGFERLLVALEELHLLCCCVLFLVG